MSRSQTTKQPPTSKKSLQALAKNRTQLGSVVLNLPKEASSGLGVPWGSSDNGLLASFSSHFSAATRYLIGVGLGFGLSLCCA